MAGKAGCRGRQQGEGTCHCVAAEADSFSYTQIWPHASPTASPPLSPLETGTQWSYLPVPQGSHSQAGRVPAHRWCQAASESRGSGTKWHRSGAPAQEGTLGKHKSSQSSTCKLQRAPSIPCMGQQRWKAMQPQAQGTHQGRPSGYTLAIAACPGSGTAHPQDVPCRSCGAPWCPHHRQLSTRSRLTKVPGLDTQGMDITGTH